MTLERNNIMSTIIQNRSCFDFSSGIMVSLQRACPGLHGFVKNETCSSVPMLQCSASSTVCSLLLPCRSRHVPSQVQAHGAKTCKIKRNN